MSDDVKTLGARARFVRKENGMTQADMAKFLAVAIGTWQKMERDETVPTGETLLRFSQLGVNPGWVLTGMGPMKLRDWNGSDADTELFIRIVRLVQQVHEGLNVPIADRSSARIAKSIFEDIARILPSAAGPDETDAVLAMQEAKLRRELLEAREAPGTGKRSA